MNRTEQLMNEVADHMAVTMEQPGDPQAWQRLLIYAPIEVLEQALDQRERLADEGT